MRPSGPAKPKYTEPMETGEVTVTVLSSFHDGIIAATSAPCGQSKASVPSAIVQDEASHQAVADDFITYTVGLPLRPGRGMTRIPILAISVPEPSNERMDASPASAVTATASSQDPSACSIFVIRRGLRFSYDDGLDSPGKTMRSPAKTRKSVSAEE